jgi:hypothetical protein
MQVVVTLNSANRDVQRLKTHHRTTPDSCRCGGVADGNSGEVLLGASANASIESAVSRVSL